MPPDFFDYSGPPSAQTPAPVPAADQGPAAAAPAMRLLAELEDEEWTQLITYTARRRYPPGAAVLRVGERAPALYFVASGQVDVSLPGAAPSRRGEGEVIGVLSFLDGAPQAAAVTAVGDVELLMLTRDGLNQLAAWQPRIAMALLKDLGAHVGARLRALRPAD
jgi:CRP-like cAMP-binding protein